MKAFIVVCLLSAAALTSARRPGRLGADANVRGRANAELRAGVDNIGPHGYAGRTLSIGGNAGLSVGGTAGLGVSGFGYGLPGWGASFGGYPYGGYGGYAGYDGGFGSPYESGYYSATPSYGYGNVYGYGNGNGYGYGNGNGYGNVYGYPQGGYYIAPGNNYHGGYSGAYGVYPTTHGNANLNTVRSATAGAGSAGNTGHISAGAAPS
ncbi:prisilkin-39-like [Dermacentor silvarum]|uniref:prisilkin-39-like n=1 Tax=Dermacentor silvarum TaxID=543639 RepID=UPI002101240A|nr:prisilkin-39-like [Dermacentor silvarum]